MITRFLSLGMALAVTCTIAAAAPDNSKLKIATVDMQELFKQYFRTNEAQKQTNLEAARIQKENNERMAKIRDIETSLGNLSKQLDDPTISDQKKQALYKDRMQQQQEGIALERERREFVDRRKQMLREKTDQIFMGLLAEIRKLVEEHARAEDFDYVFDKSGMGLKVPVLLYHKDATDITASLLKDLNKDAPPGSLRSEGDPAPDVSVPAPAPTGGTP